MDKIKDDCYKIEFENGGKMIMPKFNPNPTRGISFRLSVIETDVKEYFYMPYPQDWIFDKEGKPLRMKRKYGKYNRLRSIKAQNKTSK